MYDEKKKLNSMHDRTHKYTRAHTSSVIHTHKYTQTHTHTQHTHTQTHKHKHIHTHSASCMPVLSAMAMVLCVIIMYAILGVNLFGSKKQNHFSTFARACFTMFQVFFAYRRTSHMSILERVVPYLMMEGNTTHQHVFSREC